MLIVDLFPRNSIRVSSTINYCTVSSIHQQYPTSRYAPELLRVQSISSVRIWQIPWRYPETHPTKYDQNKKVLYPGTLEGVYTI